MERRDFLRGTGALMGACLTGSPVSANAAERAARRPFDPSGWVQQMDAQVAHLRAQTTPPILARSVEEAGLPLGYVPDAFASLTLIASFRDLPIETQAHDAVQRRVRQEAHRAGKQMIRMARYLRGLGRERRRALKSQLQADPHLLDWFAAGIRSAGGPDTEPEHVERLASSVEELTWRLKHQGPDAVIDDVVDRVTRVSEAQGLTVSEWDDVVADHDDVAEHADIVPTPRPSRREKTRNVGLVLLGLGLLSAVLGVAFLAAGSGIGAIVLTLAAILLIVGLIILATSGFRDTPGAAPVLHWRPYLATISGDLVGLVFEADGSVKGTWGTTTQRAGRWSLEGPSLAFTLDGAGESWSFEGSAQGDVLAVSWWCGTRRGGARFGVGAEA